MKRSDSIKELATALAKAQGEIKPAAKDSVNPHLKSRYADLSSVVAACREPLSKNGLSIIQEPSVEKREGFVFVRTASLLMHTSGEWVECSTEIPCVKADAQGIGSAATYGRRYGYSALVGVVADDEDDDGNGSGSAPENPEPRSGTAKAQPRGQRVSSDEIKDLSARWRTKFPKGERTNEQWAEAWFECVRKNGGPRDDITNAGSWNRSHVDAMENYFKLEGI
jgi:hypothetical protein